MKNLTIFVLLIIITNEFFYLVFLAMEEIVQDKIKSDDNYENLLNKVELEIAELNDNLIDNDDVDLNWSISQGFADFIWKEKAQQWLQSIRNVYPDNSDLPEWLQDFIDFLESIELSSGESEPLNETVDANLSDGVDLQKKYGFALDNSEYDESNSYTSRSWITYKLYDQTKWPWANYKYKDGKTMSYKWCMLTSAAIIASSLWNFSLTPWDLFKRHRHDSVVKSVPAESMWKLDSQSLSVKSNDDIISGLQEWNPVIIKVTGRNSWGCSSFTWGQHYMALLDISSDCSKIFVWNSHTADRWNYSSNWWYPTSEVLTSVKEATVFFQTAKSRSIPDLPYKTVDRI